jgi:hypothetical protein
VKESRKGELEDGERGRGRIYFVFNTNCLNKIKILIISQSEKPKSEWIYSGTWDCFVKVSKEGPSALFKVFIK